MDKAIKKVFETDYKSDNGKYTFYTKDGTLGGWWYKWKTNDENGEEIELENPCCFDHRQYQYPLLFDPLFWQALGKQQGWYLMKKNGTHLDNLPERMHEWLRR